MQAIWLLSCHTRLVHNHGAIPFEKEGVLKGPATMEVIQLTLHRVQMLDVPNTIKDRPGGGSAQRTKCLRHERKWQKALAQYANQI